MSDVTGKSRPPSRYVPLLIQEKAIRYGIRTRDPLKKSVFFRYKAHMYKLVEDRKNKGNYIYKSYRFEVLVSDAD